MSIRSAAFAAKCRTMLRASHAKWRELEANDRLDPEQLDTLRRRRSIDQARFAMEHTRFYRDLYSGAGFSVDDLRDPEAFSELPVIDKDDVRNHAEQFRSDEYSDRMTARVATGGSTGQPLVMARDTRVQSRAFEWRLFGWWGLEPWVDTAIVWRFFRTASETRRQKVMWWPSQRFQLDAFDMSVENMEAFLRRYRRTRPELLSGYVGGVVELARYVVSQGYELPPVRAVTVSAAPVTAPQRELIAEAFGGPTYDQYRCAEANWMAGECAERDGLHTFDDIKNVEVLGPDCRPTDTGQRGEVVVTDFENRVFPLVRYRIGDLTARIGEPCPCERPFRRIENVTGRASDSIVMADGQVIAGEAAAQLFSKVAECVAQFQLHQLADRSIVVRVIPTARPDAIEVVEETTEALRQLLHHAVPVRLELVDQIGHDGGKIRYIRSDVDTSSL